MNNISKFFPLSARFSNTGGELAIGIVIYMVASFVINLILTGVSMVVGFLLGLIPYLGIILAFIVGGILGLIGFVVSIYCLAGIIIEILMFAKVIK